MNNEKETFIDAVNVIRQFCEGSDNGNGGTKLMNEKLKDFYTTNYPDDDMGEDLNGTATFNDLFRTPENVYKIMGVLDSIIRERLFEELAKKMDCGYDYVYEQWLRR